MNPKRLARLIYPDFRFGETSPEYALKLVEMGVGGFCFYGGSAEEVRAASRLLKSASQTPLIIAADYEDGAGQRVPEATQLPSNMALGASGCEALARRKGEITALEARALGVDWLLAPVVDLGGRADNPIVNVRSFGSDWRLVSRLASAYLSGASSQGALAALKHFPGHGDTAADSHISLPVVAKSRQALEEEDIKPFAALARQAEAIMVGHLSLPALDADAPAALSKEIITGLLRKKLGFSGAVLTDALNMGAVPGGGSAGLKAFLAGADILLYPEDPFALHGELLRALNDGVIAAAAVDLALSRQDLLARRLSSFLSRPPDFHTLRCPEHLAFNAEVAPACLAWAYGEGKFAVKPGETLGYFEPLASAKNWEGRAFVAELARLGARVVPYEAGRGMKLAAGIFLKPGAGRGSIALGPAAKKALEAALAEAGDCVLLAFGSPFVLNGLANKPSAGLCAFCALEDFQAAAAGVVCGKVKAGGVMPVNLEG